MPVRWPISLSCCLFFFLVATTMNVDTGLTRMLPIPPENQQTEDVKVKERNVLLVLINGAGPDHGRHPGQQELIDLRQLKGRPRSSF